MPGGIGGIVTRIALVVAAAENRVIGNKGELPWRIPDDLKRFKALTLGKPCIMGRKTWQSLPLKPLPGRTNIVVTRDADFRADGARLARDFATALRLSEQENPSEIAVIGGEQIFAAALPLAHCIHLTEVCGNPEGDAFMPHIDRDQWREISRDGPYGTGRTRYSFVTLERATRLSSPLRCSGGRGH
jgi:dihydrofolate reductase